MDSRTAKGRVFRPPDPSGSRRSPFPSFSNQRPLRLAFVGQETYFRSCSLDRPVAGIQPSFVDYRQGADPEPMLAALSESRPDVVIAFRPEIFPAGSLSELGAVTLGYLTEPLPRPGVAAHPDLERRLEYLRMLDPANFDRLVSFDPLIVETIDAVAPVWRAVPLPVADEYFAPVTSPGRPPRSLFTGRSTEHRELYLARAKHEVDLIHIVHGIGDAELRDLLARTDIGVNLHNENYATFENRCAVYLAAGNLLVSETLSPRHGLEPGIDYIEVTVPQELHRVLFNATHRPEAYRRVRIRGRRKAEYFRASRVYPRLVADLLLDVATFGQTRPR